MYLTYQRYKELGGRHSETNFMRAEFNARMKINSVVNTAAINRLKTLPPDSDIFNTLEMLTLELVERSYLGQLDGNDSTSYSNEGRSMSLESKEGKAEKMIKDYLGNAYIEDIPFISKSGISFVPVKRV